jgi:hypothetical protein
LKHDKDIIFQSSSSNGGLGDLIAALAIGGFGNRRLWRSEAWDQRLGIKGLAIGRLKGGRFLQLNLACGAD